MPETAALLRFCAYAAHDGRGHVHAVAAEGFAEAAMQFVEVWHPQPDDGEQVTIIVLEQESGEQQCYRVDLAGGELEPCD